jgi:type VI secretion system protein ImpA
VSGGPDAPPADWKPVLQNGVDALATKSKDVEIAVYVIEALARLHGFAGLRDGFRMTRELVDAFWDGLYPLPDEEGLATRLAPLTSLNGDDAEGTLPVPILRIPVTDPAAGGLSCAQYQQSRLLAKTTDPKAREKKIAGGAITPEAFQKAVAETSPPFYRILVHDLTQCQEEFGKLCAALEKRCGPDRMPPTSTIRSTLTTCMDIIKDAAREKLQAAPGADAAKAASPSATAAGSPAAAASAATGEVRTREDAFQELLKLADFFRRTEPQAVLSFALEQVVRWGRLSLPDLLLELIPEEAARKNLFKQVGIRPEAKPEAPKK